MNEFYQNRVRPHVWQGLGVLSSNIPCNRDVGQNVLVQRQTENRLSNSRLPGSNNRKEELVGNKDSIKDMALRFVYSLHALYLIFCLLGQFTTGSEVKSDGALGNAF